MRLIDADALKDGYMHMGYDPNEHPEESYMEGWCKGFNAAVDHCIGHVIHAPTIEPERKKGEWVKNDNNTYSCNKCQSWIPKEQYYYANFCLYCGTEMRGKVDGRDDTGTEQPDH